MYVYRTNILCFDICQDTRILILSKHVVFSQQSYIALLVRSKYYTYLWQCYIIIVCVKEKELLGPLDYITEQWQKSTRVVVMITGLIIVSEITV